MLDKKIIETCEYISRKISDMATLGRAEPSQDMLTKFRPLVEYTALKVCPQEFPVNFKDYQQKQKAVKACNHKQELKFLYNFYNLLSATSQHDFNNEDASDHLVLKYYQYLKQIRELLAKNNLHVLFNLEDYPEDTDEETREYHRKIADVIEHPTSCEYESHPVSERYYIISLHPFFVNRELYYEVTFCRASDNTSKFDRMIAFTKLKMMSNYAVSFTSISREKISVLETEIEVMIIHDWMISIRACEFRNYASLFGPVSSFPLKVSDDCKMLMSYMMDEQVSLADIVRYEDEPFNNLMEKIKTESGSNVFLPLLISSRMRIKGKKKCGNVLLYLLSEMNNNIIKAQRTYLCFSCAEAEGLALDKKSLNFDLMPFYLIPAKYKPGLAFPSEIFDVEGREHELLGRFLRNRSENEGLIFASADEIDSVIEKHGWSVTKDDLVERLNQLLPERLKKARIKTFNKNYYVKEYVTDTTELLKKLMDISQKNLSCDIRMQIENACHSSEKIDKETSEILTGMFQSSRLIIINGVAGTGKTTLLSKIAECLSSQPKIFLASTNSTVMNLNNRINVPNSRFYTIWSYINQKSHAYSNSILFVDECSNVSNKDMRKILSLSNYKLIVLCGDAAQIEAIRFGNWFKFLPNFVDKSVVTELTTMHRTTDPNLVKLWMAVRDYDEMMLDYMVSAGYSKNLDLSLFEPCSKDEIILCTNYSGFYGINNINRIMQAHNPKPAVKIGENVFKAGDPVLFNEFKRFGDVFHNNQKGRIISIVEDKHNNVAHFTLEVNGRIENGIGGDGGFSIISVPNGHEYTEVSFDVSLTQNSDEDDIVKSLATIPFYVAYAVSVHKAQGLEYDSVKIVVSRENQRYLTHDVFYTAVTRARNKLQIYWSPESELKVVSRMKEKDKGKDYNFIRQMLKLDNMK